MIEGVVEPIAIEITKRIACPTIGIGASAECDGQVLVCNDLLGFTEGFCPKFVKRYADVHGEIVNAVKGYITDVKSRSFPAAEHTFKIDDEVLDKLY